MRKTILALFFVGIFAGLALGGRTLYRHWSTERSVSRARIAIAKGDYENGLLWLRQALAADSRRVDAIRMMGDFAELVRSPSAVGWRSRLVEVDPVPVTNRFMLARIAIAQREFVVAFKALDSVGAAEKKSSEYHKLFGALALATRSFQAAEAHFEQAVELEPDNPVPSVQLGVLLIQRNEPAQTTRGLRILEALRTNSIVRLDALRHLAFDAFRRTNYSRALRFGEEAVAEPNAAQSDRIMHLNLLVGAQSPQLNRTLTAYQKSALTNSHQAFEIGRWMLGSLGPAKAFSWLQSVPAGIATNLPVTLVVADCLLGMTNWAGLQRLVQGQRWGELEYMRSMYLTRALIEQGLTTASKTEWSKSIRDAIGHLDRLEALQGMAANWGWVQESEDTLWLIVNRYPAQKRAFVALSERLLAAGKTRSLLTLYALRIKLDPNDLSVKNNLAAVALLLGAEEHHPHQLARAVYESQTNNPTFAATYAFSLHLQMKTSESLKVMGQLAPEQLEKPNIAGYYGLFLASTGDKAKARKYLDMAGEMRQLPEEIQLFQRARL